MGCLVSAFWTNALRWSTNSLTPSSSASTEASSAHINHLVCLTKDIVTFDHLNVRSIPRRVKKTLITARDPGTVFSSVLFAAEMLQTIQ